MTTGSQEKVNILLVDDLQSNLLALEGVLQDLGERLVKAQSGEEALRYLLEEDFALILLDVRMAGMDGYETARLIRERDRSRHTPIIFLTAADVDHDDMLRGYSLGAVDYLLKPMDINLIVRSKVAVFVELYRARQREKQRERELLRIQELESTLERYQALSSSGGGTSVTSSLVGAGPVRDRVPEIFVAIVAEYCAVLTDYLDHLVVQTTKPRNRMETLVTQLGDLGAGPRDLVDLHTQALDEATQQTSAARAHAYAVEGRLLVLEMMGHLVDYYRIGSRRSPATGVSS